MIKLHQVSKKYQQSTQGEFALREVDLTIDAGEFVAIVGTSGSGKTTLLNIMGGLDRDYSGSVEVDGKKLGALSDQELARFRNQTIGFVFQHFNLLDHMSAAENVALPNAFAPAEDRKANPLVAAKDALTTLGLGSKTQENPNNLSGGQKQRVAIARALFFQPKILLCDEPTGSLDTKTGHQIIDAFEQLNNEGYTIIIITHERRVSDAAKRVIQIEDGRIVDSGAETL